MRNPIRIAARCGEQGSLVILPERRIVAGSPPPCPPTARARRPRSLCAVILLACAGTAAAFNPAAGDYSRQQPTDIRVMSYNTLKNIVVTTELLPVYQRILTAVDPDVILFQEVNPDVTVTQINAYLNATLPFTTSAGAPGSWSSQIGLTDGFNRNAVASKFPMSLRRQDTIPASEVRGVVMALLDLPDSTYRHDFYAMCVHLKASGTAADEARRIKAADAIAAWIRDIQTPGGNINLAQGTPLVYGGDTNLRTSSTVANDALLAGNISDEATYGADHPPDWDGTASTDATPRDPFRTNSSTINTHSSASTSPVSRLDRLYITDSAATIGASFVFNTLSMTTTARAALGVQTNDTRDASDHLPIAVDFRIGLAERSEWVLF